MTAIEKLALIWSLWAAVIFAAGVDEHLCPKGAQVHLASLQCYWLSESATSWLEAKGICRQVKGGDLATVRSTETQTFIHNSFKSKSTEWVWLRDGRGEGPDRSEGLGTGKHPGRDRDRGRESLGGCTQMDLGSPGQRRNTVCDGQYLFLCDKVVTVSLPSLDSYLTGVPLMLGVYARSQLQVLPTVPDPDQKRVEMLLFPGLWFSHAGQVASVELVSQPREVSTWVRFQILRPYCSPHHHLVPPGCSSLLNPFSCCSITPLCNTTGGCALGQYWCHLLEACVPVTSPCSPYNQSPSTGERSYPLPPRYLDIPPFYHLVADLPMRVAPCSEPAHISILPEREISVYPDDILSIQHTGRPGTFLSCRDNASSSSSPWRQSYLSLQGAEWGGWWEGGLSSPPDGGQWVDGVVCDLRVLYVDTLHGHGYISSSGQSELSGFTHIGNISTPISMTPETSAPAPAKSQISGLCMIHPLPDGDNQIHILVDTPILIVVKIFSGKGATSSWLAPVLQTGVPFLPSCPGELPDSWPGCERDSPDSWFSHMSLVLPSVGIHTLNVSAVNGVSEQSTCVQVCVYEPVAGLSVEPHGHLRMLVDLSQAFTATTETGSSVKYTWVIDKLDKFSYEGDTYSVMFKKPAEYKLKVTAANPVSSQTLEVTLTADTMTPLADPEFLSVKEVIAVAALHLYTFRVKVDVSLGVTFRWSFGDGSVQENHTFPAQSESQDRPVERGVRQVYVQDSVSHVYLQPDDYTLTVQVYNQYDNIKGATSLKVRPPLTRILISPSPPVPLVNQTFLLEASSYPSHYGILYTWNFGDGSKEIQGFHGKVSHVARTTGVYNMTVCANNTLTALTAWVAVAVVEKVSGLQLSCSGPSELKSVTEIKGKVASGSSLHWDWDFGDGSGHKNITDNSVSHVYESPGSYTVKVTVSNAVSQASQSIRLEVYRLAISGILPSECSETEKEIPLQALVDGNVSMLTFHWNFGDGSPLSVQKGKSVVTHTYSNSGVYNVNVTVLSIVGYVFYDANVCIEAPITGITIHPSQDAVAVGKEVCFNAVAAPKRQPTGYQFLWLNHSSNSSPIRGLAHHCFVYNEEGIHDVSVMASNKVSQSIAKATVAVQKPVSKPSIAHSSQSNTLTVNEKMTLWVKSCPGTNVSVQWDFGDGSPLAKSLNVSHVFTSAGRFTVKATASNAVSLDSVNLEVNVLLPVSDLKLKISQPFAVVGEKTVITAVGNVSGHVNFYWSVDGPDTTTELGMSHFQYVFLKAGVYQVKVTAQNLVSQQEAAILIIVLERIQGLQFSSLTSMSYIPTRESVLLTASVTHGSNVTYHWLANQRGVTQTGSVGEHFVWFTETPGNISVELTASNGLGKTTSRISLKAVERVSGARMSTARDTIPLEKYTNISVTVETGSDLQYLWNVNSDLSALQTDVPFLLYMFETLGSCSVSVSVQNVLSSSNATKHFTVQEEVREADFQVGGKTHPFFITSNTQVALYGYVNKGNDRHWEWKVVGCTGGALVLDNNQSVIYTFTDVGVYNVSLNVSNGISWQAVSHRVTIQDAIQGLTLNLSRSTVCAEDHIAFTPLVSKGTNVSFSLAFDEVEPSYDLVEVSFTTSTLPVGSHSVTARAWNKVSNSQVSLTVQVVERIGGLRLVNCCSTALEALKEVPFQAIVMSGSPTDYTWTIQLEGFQPLQVIGQEVMYTSPGSGSLSVGVMASNVFCSETLNETAIVQLPVREVTIVCDSTENFRGYSVRFSVTVDGGSNLRFQWGFGDSSEGVVVTKSNRVDHTYLTAGKYIVQVTAFNNVSQVSTQLLTEVRELQCSLPQVTLVQGQSTIVKSRSSYFEASVDIKGCTAYKTMYLWEVFRGSGCGADKTDGTLVTQSSGHPAIQNSSGHPVTLINLVGVTTPLLSLPKQALEVGQYCLGFTVSLQGTPLRLYRTSRLSVVHSSLVPIIRGGSHRLVSSHSDLILDGSESHDPDEEEGELNYHWEFITENSTGWSSQDQDQLVGYDSSRLTVPSRKLQPDKLYLFTLTVQKEGRRPISTTQSVAVSKVAVLPVSVECVSCSSLSSFRVSQSRPIVLSGRCDKCGSHVQYKWSEKDQNGVTLDLNQVTTTGSLSPELVVRPGVLQEGCNYTFTLNVTHPAGGRWGFASLTLLPNPPPHGGVCTLTPGPGENIRLLETVVTYNCSGWLDEDSESPQIIYILQVALSCPGWGQACPLLTLYRGTQRTFGSLVPLGEAGPEKDRSIISVILQVEDHLGSKVTALNRTITVLRPVDGDGITEWLRNKSQTELSGLLQQGNPQQLIPYSIALTSQLNQVDLTLSEQDLRDRREIRGNVTQALASLSVCSLQDAAQISLALAQSTAVPSEVACEGCQENVLDSVGRMIRVMEEQTRLGDDTAIETGRNILHVIGNSLAAVSESKLVSSGPHTHSNVSETAVSALDHARALMRILMRSRPRDEEPLSLSAPQISAVGYHGNPSELLCTTDPLVNTRQSNQSNKSQLNPDKPESYPAHPPCQFLIPSSLSAQLQRQVQGSEVVQILLGLEGGSEFFSAANPPISTSLAAMEFTTPQGQPIPIANLDTDRSIRVTLPLIYTVGRIGAGHRASGSGSGSGGIDRDEGRAPMVNFTLRAKGWLDFTVRAMKNMDPNAGLYISLNFSLLPGASLVGSGHVRITVATQPGHPASHDSLVRELTLSLSSQSSVEDTIFLSPLLNSTVQSLFVNLTSSLSGAPVQASVCVFSSLCQYYSPRKRRWSTEGLRPLEGSTLHSAHCLTQHLTMFGASLFVHPDAVVLLPPSSGPMRNVVVGMVCAVLVLIHFLLGLIAHKLDHLESLRLCHVPLCGQPGRYSYRVLVKTGWRRGAGTTAHVGIGLYGVTKSGSRHLQREGAFQRSGLDLFHLETDSNLGEVWKIRLWHDNTGLDPSWYVQHVVVWDPQTDHLFYFLVEDWLSVENDRNEGGGTVEKEMLASYEDLLRSIAADTGVSDSPSTSDSGRYSPRTTSLSHSQSRGSSCSGWSELSVDKPLYGTEIHNPPCSPISLHGTGLFRPSSSLSVYSIASTFLPSPSPDSTDSTTRIGVARGKPSWLLPPWALQVIYPLVVLLLGACLAVVGLYGSHFSSSVVLMWLISALSAFLTSALLLEPLKVCVQALFYAVVLRPVDPEVNDRLGQETVIKREGAKQGGKVHPPCGFGLLQAKEEARKVRALRSLMKHCVCHMLFLLVVLMVNYQDSVQETQGRLLHSAVKHSLTTNLNTITGWEGAWQWMDNILVPHLHQNPTLHLVGLPRIRCIHTPDHNNRVFLGNSSFTTRQLLSVLHSTHWTTAQLKAVSIDFTQYHRETSLFVCVSVLIEKTQIHTLISSLSIHPLLIPPSSSGPDLEIALMVLLLLSALLFLGVELWVMATDRAQYVRQGWRWLQFLLASLSLAMAALRFCFMSQAASCLSQHRSRPDSFTEFHSAALLARRSTQISAILLTLLVLKMVGTLRYVRRWVVFGRVLQRAWREMAAVALLLILLLLLFAHTGHMLFSRSVDGFLSVYQAGVSVLSVLRGRLVLQRLSRAHPVLGPLYALSLLALGGWLLARLSGAVLLRTYRVVQAEMYRPAMESQDYEMVEFFIKRLKLWMGLIKAKEFRHRVKFEGMVVPPSRSSQGSCLSTLSSPHPLSSALSLGSEDSGMSDAPGLDVQLNLDRLLSCVNGLLSRFDRVNQLTADVQGLETQLEEVQSRRRKRRPQRFGRGEETSEERGVGGGAMGRRTALLPPHSRISLTSLSPSSNPITLLSCPPSTNPSLPRVHSSYSESVVLQLHPHPPRDTHLSEATKPTQRSPDLGLGTGPSWCPGARQFPRRRAWHSGSSHSADAAQRPPQAPGGGGSGVNTKARPCSEEGDRRRASEGVPVKRRAWISEGPETDID
ncbi:polycystin-1 isoform X2 [Oncorhynchus mykiss]|nr:polycystin-1 isoform X2 [Oncorhynchus mykiss]